MKLFTKTATKLFLIANLWPLVLGTALSQAKQPKILADYFDIKAEPATLDWRFFMRASDQDRHRLWTKHLSQRKHLKDWHWGWRLGWIRSCATNKQEPCKQILDEALTDRALVVRAEAATRLGSLYAGSADHAVIAKLENAFTNKGNFRGGQPLFVQQRILYALYVIGDQSQKLRAERLAGRFPATKDYWQRLVAASE